MRAVGVDCLEGQAWGGIDTGRQLAVEHVQALGVVAVELHLFDQILGVLLLLALLLDEPVQELHGAGGTGT